jgi:hypothetical protein
MEHWRLQPKEAEWAAGGAGLLERWVPFGWGPGLWMLGAILQPLPLSLPVAQGPPTSQHGLEA